MRLYVGVKVLFKNKEGDYLLLLRNLHTYPDIQKGRWDMPGGRIETGASIFDNLKRDVEEEKQLKIQDAPRLVAAQDIFVETDKHIVRLPYMAEAEGQPILSDEHEDFRWFSFEELSKLGEERDTCLRIAIESGLVKCD